MGYLVTVKQGGHVPRSTRNVPGTRGPCGSPGIEPQRWCWRGGVWLPRVTGRCRCHGVQVRSVWRVHQFQAVPQNNESTVEGAARVARSWFMFGADLVLQATCRAWQSCPAMARTGMGTHPSPAGAEQSEMGLGGAAGPGLAEAALEVIRGLCCLSLCSCQSEGADALALEFLSCHCCHLAPV